jgi:large subunit ribosomal protein L28e
MEAIQRASAVKKSTRAVKASNKVTKLRGGKAKKAAEKQ